MICGCWSECAKQISTFTIFFHKWEIPSFGFQRPFSTEFLHIIFSFFSPSTAMATSFKLNMKCCFSSWNCSVSTSPASWIRSSHTVSHPQMVSLRVSAESCDINTIFSSYRTPREKPQFTLDSHFQQRNTDSWICKQLSLFFSNWVHWCDPKVMPKGLTTCFRRVCGCGINHRDNLTLLLLCSWTLIYLPYSSLPQWLHSDAANTKVPSGTWISYMQFANT